MEPAGLAVCDRETSKAHIHRHLSTGLDVEYMHWVRGAVHELVNCGSVSRWVDIVLFFLRALSRTSHSHSRVEVAQDGVE